METPPNTPRAQTTHPRDTGKGWMDRPPTATFGGMVRGRAKLVRQERGENIYTPLTTDKSQHAAAMVLRIKYGKETVSTPMPKERRSASIHLQEKEGTD